MLGFCLLGAACTGGSSAAVPPSPESPRPVRTGPGSTAAARKALCDVPDQTVPSGRPAEGTPPVIADVEAEVEQVRGLDYTSEVPVEPLTSSEMGRQVGRAFDSTFPTDQYERRSRAWSALGVIPAGSSLHDELQSFQTGQVVGFYVPESGRLVFIGGDTLSPLSHVVLAHELTHAVDDQHFNLDRIDSLVVSCADEQQAAAIGAVEGSAQFYSFQVAREFLSSDELLQVAQEAGASPIPDVPPFIERTQFWPYEAGRSFISALDASGGTDAVNAALRDFPVSTEQVMHPERYPNDMPTPVDVPDLGPELGEGWSDLDVSDVGEEFLNIMLGLRLDSSRADDAAAGWDGGIYRAWSNGNRVAVVMSTVWDTAADAREFAGAIADWIDAGGQTAEVQPVEGSSVQVVFASDAGTLSALQSAA